MTFVHAVLLGIVEGVTEFLPISSTGHLILAGRILGLTSSEFQKTFDIAIQLGAILAVLSLYGSRLLRSWELMKRVAVAFIPTAVIGLILYKSVKQFLGSPSVVIWALGVGGLFLIGFEYWYHEPADAHEDLDRLPYRSAFLIGLAQSVAIIPGVSRAAATVCGGLMLGLSRKAVIEFSFVLALPTMAAATGLDLLKTGGSFSGTQWGLLLTGLVTAYIVAIVSIRWLLGFIRNHDFTGFGVYRMIIAAGAALFIY